MGLIKTSEFSCHFERENRTETRFCRKNTKYWIFFTQHDIFIYDSRQLGGSYSETIPKKNPGFFLELSFVFS